MLHDLVSQCDPHLTQITISPAFISARVHEKSFLVAIRDDSLQDNKIVAAPAKAMHQDEQVLAPIRTRAHCWVDFLGKYWISLHLFRAEYLAHCVLANTYFLEEKRHFVLSNAFAYFSGTVFFLCTIIAWFLHLELFDGNLGGLRLSLDLSSGLSCHRHIELTCRIGHRISHAVIACKYQLRDHALLISLFKICMVLTLQVKTQLWIAGLR